MGDRKAVLAYLIDTYCSGDVANAATLTGYTSRQVREWFSGDRTPNKDTIEYFIHCIFTPEFKVIVEFGIFDPAAAVQTQLRRLLKGHEKMPGIYAFYDSMANLLYIGKATKLLDEACAAINRGVHVSFPRGVSAKPSKRHEIVRYISAYDVGRSEWLDYPKHVESLILRISKPPLNKNVGTLEKAHRAPKS